MLLPLLSSLLLVLTGVANVSQRTVEPLHCFIPHKVGYKLPLSEKPLWRAALPFNVCRKHYIHQTILYPCFAFPSSVEPIFVLEFCRHFCENQTIPGYGRRASFPMFCGWDFSFPWPYYTSHRGRFLLHLQPGMFFSQISAAGEIPGGDLQFRASAV